MSQSSAASAGPNPAAPDAGLSASSEFRRGWTVVVASMIGVGLCVTGLPNYAIGLFIDPLSREFGWSRSAISLWSVWQMGTLACITPVVGVLIDRFGSRRIALISIPLFTAAIASLSLLGGDIRMLYVGAVATSVLGGGTIVTLYSKAVNSWFEKARGRALGFLGSGIALASIFGPRAVQMVIDRDGWRSGFRFLALLVLLVFPFVYFLLFERDRDPGSAARAPAEGLTLKQALRTSPFWYQAAAYFLISLLTNGLMISLVPYLTDQGLTRSSAATHLGLFGLSSLAGRIITGFIFDRFRAPPVCSGIFFLSALATAALAIFGLRVSSVCIIVTGLALGSETDALGYLTARYFGMRAYGEIATLFAVGLAIGNGIGPFAISRLCELTGGYTTPFLVVSVLTGIAAFLMVLLGRHQYLEST
jgi:predicted MFS family arabinose efflux permease